MLDDTWLAFGVWLTETVVDDDTNTYVFGAFADGGAPIAGTGEPAHCRLGHRQSHVHGQGRRRAFDGHGGRVLPRRRHA